MDDVVYGKLIVQIQRFAEILQQNGFKLIHLYSTLYIQI